MRVLLVNPPAPEGYSFDRDSMGAFGNVNRRVLSPKGLSEKIVEHRHPLSLLYSGAILEKMGFEVKIVDYIFLQEIGKGVDTTLCKHYDIAVVLVAFPSLKYDCLFAKELKDNYGVHVILAGPVLRFYSEIAMNLSNADSALVNELEYSIPKVLDIIRQDGWDGLLHKRDSSMAFKGDGPVTLTPVYVVDLNKLPFPAWHLIHGKKNYDKLTMLTSRGCPFACIYCPYPVSQGKTYRVRTVENVIEEMRYLKDTFNVKYILMRDPVFSMYKDRTLNICRNINDTGFDFTWVIETRPDFLDNEMLDALAQARCNWLGIGVESANESVLNISRGGFRKTMYFQQIKKVVEKARSLRMGVTLFFVIGLPSETRETIEETIKFAEEICADHTQFTLATPYPGTILQELGKEKNLIVVDDFIEFDAFAAPSMKTESLSAMEIKEIYDNLQKRANIIATKCRAMRLRKGDLSTLKLLKLWLKNFNNMEFYKMATETFVVSMREGRKKQ